MAKKNPLKVRKVVGDYDVEIKDNIPLIQKLNSTFKKLANGFSSSVLSADVLRDEQLDQMNNEIDDIIVDQLASVTKYTGSDISTFLNRVFDKDRANSKDADYSQLERMFNDENTEVGAFFYERYRNINNSYEDLKIITDMLSELQAAVITTRDNIVSSDDLTNPIALLHDYKNISSEEKEGLLADIHAIDKEYKIPTRLKDIVYLNTLIYGNYYVYTIPYNVLFSKFEREQKNAGNGNRFAIRESYELVNTNTDNKTKSTIEFIDDKDIRLVTEAMDIDTGKKNITNKETLKKDLNAIFEGIEVYNDFEPLLEDSNVLAFRDEEVRKAAMQSLKAKQKESDSNAKILKGINPTINEKVIDTEAQYKVSGDYAEVSGVYVKYLSPLRVIPIYILDSCIGYYILYESYGDVKNNAILNNNFNKMSTIVRNLHGKTTQETVIDIMANKIVKSIDKKFLKDNVKFKELIANAITYDDLYKKNFKVQFVPAEYMTHFKVNEDIDTKMGESMLKRSLFYAKLYLLLLIFKIISITTRSNDTRVYYIKNSGIDKNIQAKVQEAIRASKKNMINFNDLSSMNSFLSKVGKNIDMYVPAGRSGEKAVDFDIISGQDIAIQNDFMEFLRKNMINCTDVPSVIMSFMDEADFAKSLVMAHNKYMTKCASIQVELNDPTTELYKKMLRFSSSQTPEKIAAYEAKLSKPRSLNVQNLNDLITNAEQSATFMLKVLCGDADKFDDKTKDVVFKYIIKEFVLPGVFDWEAMEEGVRKILNDLEVEKKKEALTKEEEPEE